MHEPLDDHERQAARLLSGRSGPSVLEKERMLAAILDQTVPAPRPRLRYWALGSGLAAMAAAALLMLAPLGEGELTRRGSGPGAEPPQLGAARAPQLRVSCVAGGRASPCTEGATLAFEVAAGAGLPYLALFGQRTDGTVVWYAPSPEGASARIGEERAVLPQAARLAAEDASPGYRVYGVFSKQPLDRAAIKQALGAALPTSDADAPATSELRVLVRALPRIEGGP
jgi:hypothetical protein